MDVGIVGLPRVGKTTLFNALTGGDADLFGDKAHVGMANIPDPNLQIIAEYFNPQKIVHATLRLVDLPGVPIGADAKRVNASLEQIRQVDAICHVVRCFDDGTGSMDPAGEIEQLNGELALADLIVAESATTRAQKASRGGEKDAKARLAVLERVQVVLEEGRSIRTVEDFGEPEQAILRGYGFITAKPEMFVMNVDESDPKGESTAAQAVRTVAEASGGTCVAVCAQLEAELGELDEADRGEMLESLGLVEPAIGTMARAANGILGLMTFYTAGPKEVRAWNCRAGSTAPEGAGVIHSDIQRGFIRVECHNIDDLVQYKSEKAIREAGKLRVEGKNYRLQQGDCVHFLFNV